MIKLINEFNFNIVNFPCEIIFHEITKEQAKNALRNGFQHYVDDIDICDLYFNELGMQVLYGSRESLQLKIFDEVILGQRNKEGNIDWFYFMINEI